jgi:16S rRNA (uracil1498-N3)-methyltransferase
VPVVHEVLTLNAWLALQTENSESERYLLSLRPETQVLSTLVGKSTAAVTFLSGPEGGLSVAEEDLALAKGFKPVSLGNRVLRAETAGLAALALFTA